MNRKTLIVTVMFVMLIGLVRLTSSPEQAAKPLTEGSMLGFIAFLVVVIGVIVSIKEDNKK